MTKLRSFGLLALASMWRKKCGANLRLVKMACAVFLLCAATAIAAAASTFTTLVNFDVTNGSGPLASLMKATDGNFYGTTLLGGTSSACSGGCGTVFKMSTSGALTTLHNFNGTDGAAPYGTLVQAPDGNFYGTTTAGGTSAACAGGCGTAFQMTPSGTVTTLHNFAFTDGSHPNGLTRATDGNFYGTAWTGGNTTACPSTGCGTVFRLVVTGTSGTVTTLHTFVATDGSGPITQLVQASNGILYGTTRTPPHGEGGGFGFGTVFQISLSGAFKTLHNFNGADGAFPFVELVQATDGNLYGTTSNGGANSSCQGGSGCGTVFKTTLAGTLTSLYSFCALSNCADGGGPLGLVQATDGNFYGAAQGGGTNGNGTIFKLVVTTKPPTLTTVHTFDGTDGANPVFLAQGTDGSFYGVTNGGGTDTSCTDFVDNLPGCGTVFHLSIGLGAFVELQPASGKVGAAVAILGTNLAGATKVSFNGTAATFTATMSEIKTSVPAGARTGTVLVTTPSGTLKSNVIFRVTPQIKSFMPMSGAVGTSVKITGVSLTQTTAVTFGGVKATSITVDSDTQVTVTVPTGAKTGHIVITTTGGTATSVGVFTVS